MAWLNWSSARGDWCASELDNCRAPSGDDAMFAKLARIAGMPAPIAFSAMLRSRPSSDAIFAIMSGVRDCMMDVTRLMAMAVTSL